MNIRTFAAASAALGLLATASVANAAITVNTSAGYPVENDLFGTTLAANGQTMLIDFDAADAANTSYLGDVLQGPQGTPTTASPPYDGDPLGDETKYASVQGGDTGTFSVAPGYALTSFSFYMGSPDQYNTLTFNLHGGGSQTFVGRQIWGETPSDPMGDRTLGYRVYYDFGGAKVQSITFASSQDAFEFDGLAGNVAFVPEPGTWALMIMGFGGAGAMIRRRKAAFA